MLDFLFLLRVMIDEEKEVALSEPPNEKNFFKGHITVLAK